jgi:hypothetical protein
MMMEEDEVDFWLGACAMDNKCRGNSSRRTKIESNSDSKLFLPTVVRPVFDIEE